MSSTEYLHYVSFTQSNSSGYAQTEARIRERDVNTIAFPDDCISFNFYDKVIYHSDDVSYFNDQEVNVSPTYYIGNIYTREELVKELGADSQFVSDFDEMLAKYAVKVKGNEYYVLSGDDKVISPSKLKFKHNSRDLDIEKLFKL